jgi:hypothetical protein
MKVKPMVEFFSKSTMTQYAKLCGCVLARAHARSGQPALISGYLGSSDKFDEAIADFSVAYADQSERDHALLLSAVRKGRLRAVMEGDGTPRSPQPQVTVRHEKLKLPRNRLSTHPLEKRTKLVS